MPNPRTPSWLNSGNRDSGSAILDFEKKLTQKLGSSLLTQVESLQQREDNNFDLAVDEKTPRTLHPSISSISEINERIRAQCAFLQQTECILSWPYQPLALSSLYRK
jgi:hypothetical protein